MINKIIRKIDDYGRINIPNFLFEIVDVDMGDEVAFVSVGTDMISFVSWEDAKEMPIIAKQRIEKDKGRILIPKEIIKSMKKISKSEELEVEIFVYNGHITIR